VNSAPFLYRDFVRAKDILQTALCGLGEPYVLLTGETGTGKTMLMRALKADLDRAHFRVLYFAETQKLGATGLVRVIAKALRVKTSPFHSESLDHLIRSFADEGQRILLWIDEAQDLPRETLAETKTLVESDLDGKSRVQALFVGLPRLRADLMALPHLWRRIVVREELTGLQYDEMQPLVEHHFGAEQARRFCEPGLRKLFEHAKGAPGVVLPMCRRVIASAAAGKARIEPEQIEDALHRWELA
jgi:general secretion pathway protein A